MVKRIKLITGTFDCESFWRSSNLAVLPSIQDLQSDNIVLAMDELQFVFAKENDILVTRYALDESFAAYLASLGFQFKKVSIRDRFDDIRADRKKNVCQCLMESSVLTELPFDSDTVVEYSPFSILQESEDVCNKFHMELNAPSINNVVRVNSKLYSYNINKHIFSDNKQEFIKDTEEFRRKGEKMLERGGLLVKDLFGVSGKGNLLISSLSVLNRVANYFELQAKRGLQVKFILEPYLKKMLDFSCQLYIDLNGKVSIVSLQIIQNRNFAYGGSYSADSCFIEYLKKVGYFTTLLEVGNRLYKDGYYGDVCIDSMQLYNRRVIPIVEINARRSMSLIKHKLDEFLSNLNLKCCFTYYTVRFSQHIEFSAFLKKLDESDSLFVLGKDTGIIPLSANTFLINQKVQERKHESLNSKGRIYVAIVFKSKEQEQVIRKKFEAVLEEKHIDII